MRLKTLLKTMLLLCALVVGSSAWATDVTYTVTSTAAVSTSGTAPTGSSATYSQSFGTAKQATSGNNFILTLKGYNGYKITKLVLSMKSNKSGGAGTLKYSIDGGSSYSWIVGSTTAAFNTSSWYGSWSTSYVNVTKNNLNIVCGSSDVIFRIDATANSLYCESYTVTYEANKTLDKIEVTNAPTKTAYKIGEPLELTGIVVTGTYDDNSTENVTSKCTFSPANGAVLGTAGNQNVTISYGGKNTTQAITVASVTGLAVKTAPTTVKYRIGDNLDLTGLVLTATYSDTETKDITGFTASPTDGSVLNTAGNVNVTLSYYGQNCTQSITVGNLSSITYNATGEGAFANTTYTEKDKFNPSGLIVTAHYSNDIDEVVTGYSLSPDTDTELKTTDENVTVSYTWNSVEKNVNIPINVNAGTKYTVTFNAQTGTCGTASLTETEYMGGVTLPSANCSKSGWVFAGWATATVSNTTTRPTLYLADDTYFPNDDITLYAVYKLDGIDDSKYKRVTTVEEVTSASSIVIVNNKDNFVLDHSRSTQNAAPTETEGLITPNANTIFTLSGNNTEGFTLTGANGTLGVATLPTSSGNKATSWTTTNNKWIVGKSSYTDNTFYLRNAASTYACLEYYSGWVAYYATGYASNQYIAMKLYVPVQNAYNSNPTDITTPTIAFDKGNTTLYLDGTTTYTNAATVTESNQSITYKSSNTSVATVSNEGVVTAAAIGEAIITASVPAELGVSYAAQATYTVTVKNTTTLAGIKAVATSSTVLDFTADLASDLVITYVNGTNAFLQNGNVGIYASCATSDWERGKKFTGAISGKVRKYYNEYQITALGQTPVAGGDVPDAVAVNISDLTTENYATYEGRRVVINGASVSTAMSNTVTSGGQISVGNNTQSINAPAQGVALTLNEKGNFVGYVGRYSNAIRFYMYEQSWFTKTHNAPQNQDMAFAKLSFPLDEETNDVTNFTGQAVTETTVKGDLSYSIKDGSDNIITSLNASTGAIVLNGARGTATIVATAAAAEDTDGEGIITPYNALSKEYTITVRPRYTVTFSVNGVETELRETSYGAGVAVPSQSDEGDFKFVGWSTANVTTTDSEPATMVDLATTIHPDADNDVYYAVFANSVHTETPGEITSVLTLNDGEVSSPSVINGVTWTHSGLTFVSSGNGNMPNGSTVSISLPSNATSIVSINAPAATAWSTKNISIALRDVDSNTEITTFNNGISYNFTVSNNSSKNYSLTATNADDRKAYMNTITVKYNGIIENDTYSNYCTTLPITVTVGTKGFATFASDFALDFTGKSIKAYTINSTDGSALTLTQKNQVAAGEPVLLYSETANDSQAIPVIASASADSNNKLVRGTGAAITWTESTKYYVLNTTNTPGFYKANESPVATNKAYLNLSGLSSRSFFTLYFDDATGISDAMRLNDNGQMINDNIYDLQGRRVATPQKEGLYIMNGRKVVIK